MDALDINLFRRQGLGGKLSLMIPNDLLTL